MFKLMILVSDPDQAIIAENAGVDRIFYDLEYINKVERQRGRNTVISHNDINDIPKIKRVLSKSKLLVRTNPIHAYSKDEVEKAISFGADILMLPMVVSEEQVKEYVGYVNGRAKVCIMIETAQALARIDDFIAVDGVNEFFVGLNDLHISLGLDFMFELVSDGLLDYLASKLNAAGKSWGFGGIARIGEGTLPAERILAEHVRLKSGSVILSRTFKGMLERSEDITIGNINEEIEKIRNHYNDISNWTSTQFSDNKAEVKQIVHNIVAHV